MVLSWKYSQYAYQTQDLTKKYIIVIYNKDNDKFYVRNFIYENTFNEKSWYYEDGIDKIFTVNDPKNLIKENDPNNENNFYMVEYINTIDFQTLSYEIISLKNEITDIDLEIKHKKN